MKSLDFAEIYIISSRARVRTPSSMVFVCWRVVKLNGDHWRVLSRGVDIFTLFFEKDHSSSLVGQG